MQQKQDATKTKTKKSKTKCLPSPHPLPLNRPTNTVKGREAGVEIFLRSLQKNTTPLPLDGVEVAYRKN